MWLRGCRYCRLSVACKERIDVLVVKHRVVCHLVAYRVVCRRVVCRQRSRAVVRCFRLWLVVLGSQCGGLLWCGERDGCPCHGSRHHYSGACSCISEHSAAERNGLGLVFFRACLHCLFFLKHSHRRENVVLEMLEVAFRDGEMVFVAKS